MAAVLVTPLPWLGRAPSRTLWAATGMLWGFYRPGMQWWSLVWGVQVLLVAMTPAYISSMWARLYIAGALCMLFAIA